MRQGDVKEVRKKHWNRKFSEQNKVPSKLGPLSTQSLSPMPQGKAVSEEVQWIVVRMTGMMSEEEISMYTQISTRKVRQIVSYFKSHGDVYAPACVRAKVHRSLSDDHINVSFTVKVLCAKTFLKSSSVASSSNPY